MPNPDSSDRERLLRLIDGGPEVLKEVQEERKPAPSGPQRPVLKKDDLLDSAKVFLNRVHWDKISFIKIGLVLFLLVLVFRSASDLMGSARSGKASGTGSSAAQADESGIGLRLVGVDWGDAPVALLEDLRTGKTYFAHQNDKIKEVRVKQIFKDKVLVVFHGKNTELR